MGKKGFMVGLLAAGSMVVTGIGASAQSEGPDTAAPTAFTGRIQFGVCQEESTELVDGVLQMRGLTCSAPILEMSDPRLEGTATLEANLDDRPSAVTLYVAAFRIEGDDGAWQQVPSLHFAGPDGRRSTKTIVFEGNGAYEGLTAVAEMSNTGDILDLRGFILEGEVPPIPDIATE
jgi:hypothetical protein